MTCSFCQIVNGDAKCIKIYENSGAIAFLEKAPLSIGHTVIISRIHYRYTHDLPENDAKLLFEAVIEVCRRVAREFGSYNVLSCNGELAGQLIPHVHYHIIPKTVAKGLQQRWESMIEIRDLAQLQQRLLK